MDYHESLTSNKKCEQCVYDNYMVCLPTIYFLTWIILSIHYLLSTKRKPRISCVHSSPLISWRLNTECLGIKNLELKYVIKLMCETLFYSQIQCVKTRMKWILLFIDEDERRQIYNLVDWLQFSVKSSELVNWAKWKTNK